MTLLSQSLALLWRVKDLLRALDALDEVEASLDTAPAPGRGGGEGGATPAPCLVLVSAGRPPLLRLVSGATPRAPREQEPDSPIRVGPAPPALSGPLVVGAPAFLAGTGARLYSLDAWRREHMPGGRTPHAA